MNLQEEYKNIISTLSENMFRDFVKEYVKAYWKTDEVEITDGPWDGGVDLVFYKNNVPEKRNIQVTVQDVYHHYSVRF